MRISSASGNFLDLERVHKEECAGDVFVFVRLRHGHCYVELGGYVDSRAWLSFTRALTDLEKRRTSEVRLASVRDGELVVSFAVTARHLKVKVSTRTPVLGTKDALRVTADLVFDVSLLTSVAAAAEELAREIDAELGYLADELASFNRVSGEDAGAAIASVERARIYRWLGRLDEALKDCEAVLAQRPQDAPAQLEKTMVMTALERRLERPAR